MSRLFGTLVPGLDVKPLIAELQGAGRRGARLRAGGREPGGVRRRRTPATPTSCVPAVVDRQRPGAGHRVGRRHAAVRGSSPTARRRSATGPACCWRGSCSPGRPAPACCTPIRTRATSGCSTTAGSACSTSAPSTGCPTACPSRSAGCSGWRSTATPRACSTGCARRASSSRAIDLDAEAVLDYLAPILEPARADDVPLQPRLAARAGDARRRPALTGVQHRAAAQPAAGVPADPPRDAGHHRRAVPARGRGPAGAPSSSTGCPASRRSPATEDSKQGSPALGVELPSIARTFSRLHRSQ